MVSGSNRPRRDTAKSGAPGEEPIITQNGRKAYCPDVGFVFGANVPQDSQDFQDYHDPLDSHRLEETSIEVEKGNSDDPLQLPLSEYVRKALEFSEQLAEERETLHWRSPMFDF